MAIIAFFTIGFGDQFPTSIEGRIVNTLIILGGMLSSATIIGLVHEYLHLSDEETHIFSFIKSRRKEKVRKQVAGKLIYILLKMKVLKSRELSLNNIKWRNKKQYKDLTDLLLQKVCVWKVLN